jgi:hypothetical protein
MIKIDLRKELLKAHSLLQCRKIVQYVDADPNRFSDLVDTFLSGPYRITQRAAWPLGIVVEKHPELIKPHFRKLLDFASRNDVHPAVKRNILRMLQFTELPNQLHGRIADISFSSLSDRKAPIAIRVFAMAVLSRLAKFHPELKNDLRILIEDELAIASPAFSSRGRKVLEELDSL